MNHEHIDAADVRSRYVTRRLSSEEERQFEEHLVDCAECQDDVQREMDLRDGLRQLPPARSEPSSVRDRRAIGLVLLAAAAALLLAVSVTLAMTLRSTSSELRSTRAAASALEQRAASATSSAAELAARLAAAERLGAAAQKGASTAIAFLTPVRGASGGSDAINRVTIGSDITSLVLSIELDQPSRGAEFTASIAEAAGSEIWRGGPFRAYSQDALAVTVDAALLHDGDYVLTLQRRTQDGRASSVTHRLRIARQK